jgi:hypothetical protein
MTEILSSLQATHPECARSLVESMPLGWEPHQSYCSCSCYSCCQPSFTRWRLCGLQARMPGQWRAEYSLAPLLLLRLSNSHSLPRRGRGHGSCIGLDAPSSGSQPTLHQVSRLLVLSLLLNATGGRSTCGGICGA